MIWSDGGFRQVFLSKNARSWYLWLAPMSVELGLEDAEGVCNKEGS